MAYVKQEKHHSILNDKHHTTYQIKKIISIYYYKINNYGKK